MHDFGANDFVFGFADAPLTHLGQWCQQQLKQHQRRHVHQPSEPRIWNQRCQPPVMHGMACRHQQSLAGRVCTVAQSHQVLPALLVRSFAAAGGGAGETRSSEEPQDLHPASTPAVSVADAATPVSVPGHEDADVAAAEHSTALEQRVFQYDAPFAGTLLKLKVGDLLCTWCILRCWQTRTDCLKFQSGAKARCFPCVHISQGTSSWP